MRCRMCGRVITDRESTGRGFGPVCWAQMHPASAAGASDEPPEVIQIPGQITISDWREEYDGESKQEG